MTSPSDSRHDRFGAAYSEWLKARGAYYEPDLEDDECEAVRADTATLTAARAHRHRMANSY